MPILLAVPLLVLLTAFVALGSAALQHSVSTGFVNWLSRVVGNIPIVGGVLSMKQILKLDGWVLNLVGKHYKQVEGAAVGWIVALDQTVRRHSKAALGLAGPVWAFAYWITHTEIRRQAQAHDKPIAKQAAHADALAVEAVREVAGLQRGGRTTIKQSQVTKIEHVVMPHAAEWDWLTHHWGGLKRAISLAAVGALAPTLPRVHVPAAPWGLTPTRLRRMLRGLGVPIGVAAMAVAISSVFRVTPRCVTNGNIGRLMRGICRSPKWLLDLLLVGTVEAFIITDLCAFTDLLMAEARAVVPALMELVDAEDALIGCHGTVKPLVFKLPPADPTPLQGVSPLAA